MGFKKWPDMPKARVGDTPDSNPIMRLDKGIMKTKTAKTAKSPTLKATSPLQIKSILVPVDFSPPSKKALDYAVEVARQFKAKLTLLHVIEPVAMPDFAMSFPLAMENDELMAMAKEQMERAVKAGRVPRGIVERILVRFGRSFPEIAEASRTLKVDLIILSTHGYTGLKHALLGSTTERVVRHAPCPVLVVKTPKSD